MPPKYPPKPDRPLWPTGRGLHRQGKAAGRFAGTGTHDRVCGQHKQYIGVLFLPRYPPRKKARKRLPSGKRTLRRGDPARSAPLRRGAASLAEKEVRERTRYFSFLSQPAWLGKPILQCKTGEQQEKFVRPKNAKTPATGRGKCRQQRAAVREGRPGQPVYTAQARASPAAAINRRPSA